MTCTLCARLKEQIARARTAEVARLLAQHLLDHKLRHHNRQVAPLYWSNWPMLGICPHCLKERAN